MTGPILIFSVMLVWSGLHSFLAGHWAKAAVRRIIGPAADRFYRLAFNALAILTFLPVLAVLATHIGHLIYWVGWPWWIAVEFGQISGAVLLVASFLRSDPAYFSGLRQLGVGNAAGRLVTTGPYAIVRHPLYTTALIALWCSPILTTGILAFNIAATLYILIGSELEERKLVAEYGDEYRNYKRRVARLIPFIF